MEVEPVHLPLAEIVEDSPDREFTAITHGRSIGGGPVQYGILYGDQTSKTPTWIGEADFSPTEKGYVADNPIRVLRQRVDPV